MLASLRLALTVAFAARTSRAGPLRAMAASSAAATYRPAQAPIVRRPVGPHTHTLIMLHGLGDTGNGWSDVDLPGELRGLKLVFPTASVRPVTLNGGMSMTAWSDIRSLSALEAEEDAAGFAASASYVQSLIAAEVAAGIPHNRIFLAGFSQGGAVALHVGLRTAEPLAGVLGLSTWLPLSGDYPAAVGKGAAATPFLLLHGTADQVVRTEYGQQSHARLKELGIASEMKLYRGLGHGAAPEELDDLAAFLTSRLTA
jgi:lysophospholipase II